MNDKVDFVACGSWRDTWSVKCVAVPGRYGVDPNFHVEQFLDTGSVVVETEEDDEDFPLLAIRDRYFPDGRAAAAWLRRAGHKVPIEVLQALRANDLKPLHNEERKMTFMQRTKRFAARLWRKSMVKAFLRGLLAFRSTTSHTFDWPDDRWAYLHGRAFAHRVTFRLFVRVVGGAGASS
ncbi:hypothetical protein LFL96_37020 (plasmid) [Paraburkholderia sp. D15]|uniref:hypothetical protein n=1 Tax=Paraburkholderia sp. D15 TaxID=2880218 RepID=UPI002478C83D|nr:hypothetical protein [Paraburkholderia sp. D15]WGS55082.1 hypothetical protein LFL96_37020 [Paraburkholderia sp. D15]